MKFFYKIVSTLTLTTTGPRSDYSNHNGYYIRRFKRTPTVTNLLLGSVIRIVDPRTEIGSFVSVVTGTQVFQTETYISSKSLWKRLNKVNVKGKEHPFH